MSREERRELDRTPLTRLTGRSAISLLGEMSLFVALTAFCWAITFLAVLDILRNRPGNQIFVSVGVMTFYIGCLAMRRLHRFIYPM
jgi:hypothetical protein